MTYLGICRRVTAFALATLYGGVGAGLLACSQVSDILNVPPPTGVSSIDGLKNRTGAEAIFNDGKALVFGALGGNATLIFAQGLLSDEFSASQNYQNIDARRTVSFSGYNETSVNNIIRVVLDARSRELLSIPLLQQYEPATGQKLIGEAFALVAYTELFLAEDFCAGVPLSRTLPDGGIEYGHPLSTDSLLATAEAHFDSALVYAHGDTAVMSLASVGLARVRLNRGHFTEASAAVAGVATSFVYNIEMSPTRAYSLNLYAYGSGLFQGCSYFNVADRDGGNGQNFVSAADPRLVTDTTIGVTCDRLIAGNTNGAAMNYPTKFGNPSTFIPLATGVEARLIEAEAALQANQVSNWAGTLDALRDAAPQTYLQLGSALPHLTSDSTTAAPSQAFREDVMFRERAFWLFGTGTRLGDMRRLIRQYHRAADSVFPAGTYTENTATNITSYGTDVSLTLPTLNGGAIITNPYYTGCLTSPATP